MRGGVEVMRGSSVTYALSAVILLSGGQLGCDDDDADRQGIVAADSGADGGGIANDGPTRDASDSGLRSVCPPQSSAQRVVATSGDGALLAFLRCKGSTVEVVAQALQANAPEVVLASGQADYSVEVLLDGEHVLFGAGGKWFVRAADASVDAVAVAAGAVLHTRAFSERVSSTSFEPRLLVMEQDEALRRVTVRQSNDGYSTPLTIFEDADLQGGLENLSASGRTLVVTLSQASGRTFFKLRTNNAADPFDMPFGPDELAMAPVGLGDTHNFAFDGEKLVRVKLEDGKRTVLVETGLLNDPSQLLEREHAPGEKFAHFIVNGNPSRRDRNAEQATETLATANAIAQALSPDNNVLIYLSDNKLFSVPAVGGAAPVELISDTGALSELVVAFAPDSSELAMRVADGGLVRSPLTAGGAAVTLEAAPVLPESIAYSADGAQLLWITQNGTLRAAALSAGEARTLAENVSLWVAIPGGNQIAYVAGGKLQRTAL